MNIEDVEEKCFTTEDGVDMYVGDKYWTLRTKDKNWLFEDSVRENINYFYGSNKDYSKETGIYYFSTEEKAKEYILMNTPCLSFQDILNNAIVDSNDRLQVSAKSIIKLIKSRL